VHLKFRINSKTNTTIKIKSQVSMTVTHGVVVVGVAGWPVILTGWPAGRWRVSQPAADADRYRCACAGHGDGYQCGLDWGRSRL